MIFSMPSVLIMPVSFIHSLSILILLVISEVSMISSFLYFFLFPLKMLSFRIMFSFTFTKDSYFSIVLIFIVSLIQLAISLLNSLNFNRSISKQLMAFKLHFLNFFFIASQRLFTKEWMPQCLLTRHSFGWIKVKQSLDKIYRNLAN